MFPGNPRLAFLGHESRLPGGRIRISVRLEGRMKPLPRGRPEANRIVRGKCFTLTQRRVSPILAENSVPVSTYRYVGFHVCWSV